MKLSPLFSISLALGALVILTSYAIGPFSQQALQTYSCDRPSEGIAKIAIAEWVGQADVNPTQSAGIWLSSEMQGSMINGLIDRTPSSSLRLSDCESSNCTFRAAHGITHQSVGVCSQCTDATSQLVENHTPNGLTSYVFGNESSEFSLNMPSSQQLVKVVLNMMTGDTPDAFKNDLDFESGTAGTIIAAFTAAGCVAEKNEKDDSYLLCHHSYGNMPNLDRSLDVVAAKCSLYPCLRYYHGEVLNGILNETLVFSTPMHRTRRTNSSRKSYPNYLPKKDDAHYFAMAEPCIVHNKPYDMSNISQAPKFGVNWTSWTTKKGAQHAPSECLRAMEYQTFVGIEQFLYGTLNGRCEVIHGGASTSAVYDALDVECVDWWTGSFRNNGRATLQMFSTAFEGMATAASNRMRLTGMDWSKTSRAYASGTANTSRVCIQLNWPWLFYPGTILVTASGLPVAALA